MNNKHDAEPPALIDYRHRFALFYTTPHGPIYTTPHGPTARLVQCLPDYTLPTDPSLSQAIYTGIKRVTLTI
jgi:hypothetical protein